MSESHIWHPESVRSLYEFFRTTPPFNKWRLPDGDEVEFHVVKIRDAVAEYESNPHRIRINYHKISHLSTLCAILAHEMVHLACDMSGESLGHGAHFKRRAKQVCRIHGFDPKEF